MEALEGDNGEGQGGLKLKIVWKSEDPMSVRGWELVRV